MADEVNLAGKLNLAWLVPKPVGDMKYAYSPKGDLTKASSRLKANELTKNS